MYVAGGYNKYDLVWNIKYNSDNGWYVLIYSNVGRIYCEYCQVFQ